MAFMQAYPERKRPEPLTGPMRTRAEARAVYGEVVEELNACGDQETLEVFLMTASEPLIQFENELPFYWEGDGQDFLGLAEEIRRAWLRVTAEW